MSKIQFFLDLFDFVLLIEADRYLTTTFYILSSALL